MGILGKEYKEEDFRILQPEPPTGDGGDDSDNGDDEPENNPEGLTDEEIDDIIEGAKKNGFDGIDNEGVIDEDDEEDLTPEPDEEEETAPEPDEDGEEKAPGDEGEQEQEGKEGEEEGAEEGAEEGDEEGDEEDPTPEFEDISKETEEDKQRRLKVRYANLMKKIQNGQKSMLDIANKHGKKIPKRIVGQMKQSSEYLQDIKETNIYED